MENKDSELLINEFGYVISIYNDKQIIKTLKAGFTSFFPLEKGTNKVTISVHPVEENYQYNIGDFILVATDKTCNLHCIFGFKNNTIQTYNKFGKGNGYINKNIILGKVISVIK